MQTLREQADAGKVVVLISSELDELLEVSDRIGVMYNGHWSRSCRAPRPMPSASAA